MLRQEPTLPLMPPATWTVTQVNARAKELLERGLGTLEVAGEISNYRHDRSGHRYFSLKDAGGVIAAALFRQRATSLRFEPRDGMQVVARGIVTIYGPSGRYQLMVTGLTQQGAGALQAAFEALKAKLQAEGLFDAARKRPLPLLPRRIAVITSPTGSVWRDIRNVSARRFHRAPLLLVPSRTQGAECATEVAAAIRRLGALHEALGIDVIIVARGGGSLEDLWGFNDETVARSIAQSPIPVVSAIGHETDFTIADFVADVRAPTPSAAAELVVPKRSDLAGTLARASGRIALALTKHVRHDRVRLRALTALLGDGRRIAWPHTQRLAQVDTRLAHALERRLAQARMRFGRLEGRLAVLHPRLSLSRQRAQQTAAMLRIVGLVRKLLARKRAEAASHGPDARHFRHRINACRAQLAAAHQTMLALSPQAVLERGYSITTDQAGHVVRRAEAVAHGAMLHVRLAEGALAVVAQGRARDDGLTDEN